MRLHHLMEHAILVRIQGLLIFQPLREDIAHVIGQAILMAPRTFDELRVHGLRHFKGLQQLGHFLLDVHPAPLLRTINSVEPNALLLAIVHHVDGVAVNDADDFAREGPGRRLMGLVWGT